MKINREAPTLLLHTQLRSATGGVVWAHENLLGSISEEGGGQKRETKTMTLKAEQSAQPQPTYVRVPGARCAERETIQVGWTGSELLSQAF